MLLCHFDEISQKLKINIIIYVSYDTKIIMTLNNHHRNEDKDCPCLRSLNLYTFGLLASVFRHLRSSIAKRKLYHKQPAEGVPVFKISSIFKMGTPQSRIEVV